MLNRRVVTGGNSDTELKARLVKLYGFADKRIKDLRKSRRFYVDDRYEKTALDASGRDYFGWFCAIIADVDSDQEVTLTLENSIPPVSFDSLAATTRGGSVRFSLTRDKLPALRATAKEISRIGVKDAWNKFDMPRRTANSLATFAKHLDDFWKILRA
jgi:hypothetical protein